MKVKTSELIGAALNWVVAQAEGATPGVDLVFCLPNEPQHVVRAFKLGDGTSKSYNPSTDWAQGGPIIDREGIGHYKANSSKVWAHPYGGEYNAEGPTALIAAMRCYVISKLGDEVEIPEALKG